MEPEKIAILGKRKLAYMLSLSGFLTKELLAYYFGTYVCPECGKKMPVLTGMEGFYFGE